MHGQFGLNLKTSRQSGEGLDEATREDTVAREQVRNALPKQACHQSCQHSIAQEMPGAVRRLDCRLARPVDHVEGALEQHLNQCRGDGCIVGVIAISEHEHVGFDIGEHPTHHVALAAQGLRADHGAGGARDLHRPIRRSVVVYEHYRARQCVPEVLYHLAYRGGLVEARDQDRNVREAQQRRRGRVISRLLADRRGTHWQDRPGAKRVNTAETPVAPATDD